jgi:hypothetical protein
MQRSLVFVKHKLSFECFNQSKRKDSIANLVVLFFEGFIVNHDVDREVSSAGLLPWGVINYNSRNCRYLDIGSQRSD